ncbi:hypothetical protein, variant [Cladophialophora immunda]|uniref:Vegetative cell wall protein gp1 n=1 Tax=Cladophialophora immunda TaxID=569365 RepID=A0A0D2B970_9EURO|nr:hypothetical protein, variant [Cladophialophora immunda]KIW34162.1 hypothetical protein, variant [Cladophialophora immunda]
MSYHYGVPPSHYTKYYGTSSPYSSGEYVHYAPQYESTPKKHARKTSYTPSPRVGGWYSPAGSPPPHHEPNVQYSAPRDDVYEQIIDEQPKRSRARRASTTSKPTPKSKPKPAPQATEEDAIRAGIPAGYSIKHWDPTELPIILLGSVFDANSLGKWIYDWTVFHHGASTPIADIAGELWLLLIKLAGKMKRAEECVDRIRNPEKQETVEDFIISGKRLWEKFKALLKDCEHFMLKAAKRDGSKTMGKKAGTEFVDSIFGRDRHLEATEKIMNQIRLWNMRFDVNCEETLRRPSVA